MQNETITYDAIRKDIQNGDLTLAYNKLEVYLQSNHSEKRAINLHEKLRKQIYKSNVAKVKDALNKSEFLWKGKKYKQLLSLYLQLQQYAPNYEKLNKLISKAYNLQHKEELQNQDSILSKITNIVNGYIGTKNYQEAIHLVEQSVISEPQNPLLQKLLLDTKRMVIDKKIKENKSVFKKADPKEVYDFIKQLYDMEPTYFKIQKLYNDAHNMLKKYYDGKKYVFENDAKRQIQILFNQGEYNKAKQACHELIRACNDSTFAKKYIKKSNEKIEAENYKIAYMKLNGKSSDVVEAQHL